MMRFDDREWKVFAYECIFSDDVKRFYLKHHDDNKLILLFMGVAISQQEVKYQYAISMHISLMSSVHEDRLLFFL